MERDGEREDFQGNGKSLREGNTREKQSKEEMHLPDREEVSQQLHELCHSSVVLRLTGEGKNEKKKVKHMPYSPTVLR